MKIDFLRIVKLALYAVSFAEIILFSHLAKKNGGNMKMMIITLILLALNAVIYKLFVKYRKKQDKKDVA